MCSGKSQKRKIGKVGVKDSRMKYVHYCNLQHVLVMVNIENPNAYVYCHTEYHRTFRRHSDLFFGEKEERCRLIFFFSLLT